MNLIKAWKRTMYVSLTLTLTGLGYAAAPADEATNEIEESYSGADLDTFAPLPRTKNSGTASAVIVSSTKDRVELIKERYPSGAVKVEREVTQDAQHNYINHGSWKMFDERGTLVGEGRYENNLRQGIWNRWYLGSESKLFAEAPFNEFQGPFVSQATFRDGNLHGPWSIYDSKQRKICEIGFENGQRHGTATWLYVNGQRMRENVYRNGVIDGDVQQWDHAERLVSKFTFQDGRQIAPKVTHHDNGRKKSEGMYLNARLVPKTLDDWWTAQPATYTTEGRDERHGNWTSWHPNGQIQIQGEFKNDVPVGRFTWYYATGQKSLEGSYVRGKQEGPWVWWHENGLKKTEGAYSAGIPTGRWFWWKADGIVAQQAEMSDTQVSVEQGPGLREALVAPMLEIQPQTQR